MTVFTKDAPLIILRFSNCTLACPRKNFRTRTIFPGFSLFLHTLRALNYNCIRLNRSLMVHGWGKVPSKEPYSGGGPNLSRKGPFSSYHSKPIFDIFRPFIGRLMINVILLLILRTLLLGLSHEFILNSTGMASTPIHCLFTLKA